MPDSAIAPDALVSSLTRHSSPPPEWRYEQRPIERGHLLYCEVVELDCYPTLDVLPGYDHPITVGQRIVLVAGVRGSSTSMSGQCPRRHVSVGETLDMIAAGGIVGEVTALPADGRGPTIVRYLGSVIEDGTVVRLCDSLGEVEDCVSIPVVVVAGSSAEVGKTRAACIAISALCNAGYDVTGIKLKGTGRMRDIVGYRKAGAKNILDFVDAGIESTYSQPNGVVTAATDRIIRAASSRGSVIVAELGGDPLSGGGLEIIQSSVLQERTVLTVLVGADVFALYGSRRWLDEIGWPEPIIHGPTRRNNVVVDKLLASLDMQPTVDGQQLADAVLATFTASTRDRFVG